MSKINLKNPWKKNYVDVERIRNADIDIVKTNR